MDLQHAKDTEPSPWHAIATAPHNCELILTTEGNRCVRAKWERLDSDNSGWGAVKEGEHPSSWTNGFCWAINEDEEPSDPPRWWAYPPAAIRL